MELEYRNTMTDSVTYPEIDRERIDGVLRKLIGEHCRKVQYIDLTADTFLELTTGRDEKDEEGMAGKLSEAFRLFADGPYCHDNDRARFRKFTALSALRAALQNAGPMGAGIVYRGKFDLAEMIYHTVALKLYPVESANGNQTAILLLRDITEEIQQYSDSLEEDAKTRNHLPGKRTILVVEDNEMNREMLEAILEDEYQILQAENGAIGLELLQKYMMQISAVILDVQMPVMDGYEFLKLSQKNSFLSQIPVIVATGSNSLEEECICLGLGASDFVGKPYNPEIIRSRISNIIRLKESTATMSELQTDDRTGLYTLQAFSYHAKLMLEQDPETDWSLIVFDADHFRQISENYGAETGSRVLKQIAGALDGCLAGSDIYGRYGTARFLVLRPQLSGEETDAWIGELFSSLETGCNVRGISFRAGIYENVDGTLPVPVICDRAIAALNGVRQDYQNRFARYDEKHAADERRLAVMEEDMWKAYEMNQFSVYYQPKHDAKTGKLMGAEALIRWIHPEYGFLSPGEFIPLFERNGFVSYADYYVLQRTCSNLKNWMAEGITPIPISVNSSRRDFSHEHYVETLLRPLQENGIDPSLIHIEVTESMFSDRLDEISQILRECREAGFQIELDDFGSGYSSLTTLTILPLDVMKLDMSFMKNYKDEKKRKVLATCINLAKNLGLKTVCEGVELEDQLTLLREYGCDLIQGYYYSKPIPEKEFREYLIAHQ